MKFEISDFEVIKAPYDFQIILNLLKDKGAPIKGSFLLDIDDNYTVVESYDWETRLYSFIFNKKEKK